VISLQTIPGGKPPIVAGTRNAGVVAVDLGGWSSITERTGLPNDLVTCFAEGIGTGNGVLRWDEISGKMGSDPGGDLPSIYFQSLLPKALPGGRWGLWAATLQGLRYHDGRRWTRLGKEEGFPEGSASTLPESFDAAGKGTLWVGLPRGLAWLQDGKWHFEIAHEAFPGSAALALRAAREADGENSLWVATRSEALRRFKGGKWYACGLAEGLPSLNLTALQQSADGRGRPWLWVGANDGRLACLALNYPETKWAAIAQDKLPGLSDSAVRGQDARTRRRQPGACRAESAPPADRAAKPQVCG